MLLFVKINFYTKNYPIKGPRGSQCRGLLNKVQDINKKVVATEDYTEQKGR